MEISEDQYIWKGLINSKLVIGFDPCTLNNTNDNVVVTFYDDEEVLKILSNSYTKLSENCKSTVCIEKQESFADTIKNHTNNSDTGVNLKKKFAQFENNIKKYALEEKDQIYDTNLLNEMKNYSNEHTLKRKSKRIYLKCLKLNKIKIAELIEQKYKHLWYPEDSILAIKYALQTY